MRRNWSLIAVCLVMLFAAPMVFADTATIVSNLQQNAFWGALP